MPNPQTAWLIREPKRAGLPTHAECMLANYDTAYETIMRAVDGGFEWSNQDNRGFYHRCILTMHSGWKEVWELEEVALQTSVDVTFYDQPEDTYYSLNMLISDGWIDITATRSKDERETVHRILSRDDFITWVQTDPMFQRGDLWGMLQYAVEVHGMPDWVYKVRPLQ